MASCCNCFSTLVYCSVDGTPFVTGLASLPPSQGIPEGITHALLVAALRAHALGILSPAEALWETCPDFPRLDSDKARQCGRRLCTNATGMAKKLQCGHKSVASKLTVSHSSYRATIRNN